MKIVIMHGVAMTITFDNRYNSMEIEEDGNLQLIPKLVPLPKNCNMTPIDQV